MHFICIGLGPVAPFFVAIPCFIACFIVVATTWDENYGDKVIERDINPFFNIAKLYGYSMGLMPQGPTFNFYFLVNLSLPISSALTVRVSVSSSRTGGSCSWAWSRALSRAACTYSSSCGRPVNWGNGHKSFKTAIKFANF